MNHLVYEMFENGEKCPPQFPRVHGVFFKLFVLSNQQWESELCSVYNYTKQRRAAEVKDHTLHQNSEISRTSSPLMVAMQRYVTATSSNWLTSFPLCWVSWKSIKKSSVCLLYGVWTVLPLSKLPSHITIDFLLRVCLDEICCCQLAVRVPAYVHKLY